MYCYALQLGMICLTGTRNATHMEQDFAIDDFALDAEEMQRIMHVSR